MSTSRVIGRLLASTTALAAGIGALLPGSAAPREVTDAPVSVILAATTSAVGRAAVERLGGQVTHELPFIDSVAATVPASAVSLLEQAPGVLGVVPDEKVHVQGGFSAADVSPEELPPSVYQNAIKSDELAATGAKGLGVTVALIDTGITMNPDLEGRVTPVRVSGNGETALCKNLSGTPDCDDGYGHGTFMAGLIVGNGASSGGAYKGVATEAQVLSIKVASDDGSADVSNVLAGIQWAVSFKDKYQISVLNLSLGTDSSQSRLIDPLNRAVERAWRAGITVVVAASNLGPGARTISKPGDDPFVVTVGAVDDQKTASIVDDVLPDFSARGPVFDVLKEVHKPDVVAPGAHLVSLNVPGSAISEAFHDDADGAYLQGSGTSMATAVVSGVVAQVLSANPTLTPNRIKYILRATAHPVANGSQDQVGKGIIDALAAGINPPAGKANKNLLLATDAGLILSGSRANMRVAVKDLPASEIAGEFTGQLSLFDVNDFLSPWTPQSWRTSQWTDGTWVQTEWSGDNWEGDNWEGCAVGGGADDVCTYGGSFSGSEWYGAWH